MHEESDDAPDQHETRAARGLDSLEMIHNDVVACRRSRDELIIGCWELERGSRWIEPANEEETRCPSEKSQ